MVVTILRLCKPFHFNCPLNHNNHRLLCSINPDNNAGGFSDDNNCSANNEGMSCHIHWEGKFFVYYMHALSEGSMGKSESNQKESFSSKDVLKKLRRYGISGVLSYVLLNTAYYLTMFLVVWFFVAPVPGRMGYVAAVERFLKVMAMVWAGSQVTKLVRAAGALALAPFVDRGLTCFTVKFKYQTQGKANETKFQALF